jgi:translation initiation factor IF-2
MVIKKIDAEKTVDKNKETTAKKAKKVVKDKDVTSTKKVVVEAEVKVAKKSKKIADAEPKEVKPKKVVEKAVEKIVKKNTVNNLVEPKAVPEIKTEKIAEKVVVKDIAKEQDKSKFKRGEIRNRKKYKKEKREIAKTQSEEDKKIASEKENVITISEALTVNFLAQELKVPGTKIITKLMSMGVLATLNQKLDFDTAVLIASEYGYELEFAKIDDNDLINDDEEYAESDYKSRPPVITIMGHVDHGKTSLLDVIRKTDVVSGEAGGITQHIGAYQVNTKQGVLTFLDTPGHAAFTAMRARGVQVTDIAVIVVAANDGVMPQTIEAIDHAKAGSVPIIVAINKIDLPDANPDKVMQELSSHGLVSEEWGGTTIMVKISAKTNTGIDTLLEMLALQAEMMELKAICKGRAKGVVIEAELNKKRGAIATVLLQKGVLKKGDIFISGTSYGKVRELIDDKDRRLKEVYPATPVEVLGFNGVPESGDIFMVIEDEKEAKKIVDKRKEVLREERLSRRKLITLEDLNDRMQAGEVKDLKVIIKADVRGSVEALKDSLERLGNDEIKLIVLHSGTGSVNESDIMLAAASDAIIISFNVDLPNTIKSIVEKEGVEVREYKIIYEAIEEIKNAMEGLLDPEIQAEFIGRSEIRQIINIPKLGVIAGCMVTDGKMERGSLVRVIRDGKEVFKGKMDVLKRFKDNVKEVDKGFECGISLIDFNDYHENDIIEAFKEKKVLRKLK